MWMKASPLPDTANLNTSNHSQEASANNIFPQFPFSGFFLIRSPQQDIERFLTSIKVTALRDSKFFPQP